MWYHGNPNAQKGVCICVFCTDEPPSGQILAQAAYHTVHDRKPWWKVGLAREGWEQGEPGNKAGLEQGEPGNRAGLEQGEPGNRAGLEQGELGNRARTRVMVTTQF